MKSKLDKSIKISLFHMENCTHCEEFESEWKELTSVPQKNIAFNDYERRQMENLSESERTINGEEINGFPTIKINVFDKEYYYNKERTKQGILEFVRDKLKNRVNGVETEMSDSPQLGGQDSESEDPESEAPESEAPNVLETTTNVTPSEEISEEDISTVNEESEQRSPSETEPESEPEESKPEESKSEEDKSSEKSQGSLSIFAKDEPKPPEPDTTGGGLIRSEFDRLLLKEIDTLSDHPFYR